MHACECVCVCVQVGVDDKIRNSWEKTKEIKKWRTSDRLTNVKVRSNLREDEGAKEEVSTWEKQQKSTNKINNSCHKFKIWKKSSNDKANQWEGLPAAEGCERLKEVSVRGLRLFDPLGVTEECGRLNIETSFIWSVCLCACVCDCVWDDWPSILFAIVILNNCVRGSLFPVDNFEGTLNRLMQLPLEVRWKSMQSLTELLYDLCARECARECAHDIEGLWTFA